VITGGAERPHAGYMTVEEWQRYFAQQGMGGPTVRPIAKAPPKPKPVPKPPKPAPPRPKPQPTPDVGAKRRRIAELERALEKVHQQMATAGFEENFGLLREESAIERELNVLRARPAAPKKPLAEPKPAKEPKPKKVSAAAREKIAAIERQLEALYADVDRASFEDKFTIMLQISALLRELHALYLKHGVPQSEWKY
jgi:hypothetical protein